MLDLYAWMTLQSKVVKYHFRNFKQHYALTHFVKKSWRSVKEQTLTKMWEHFIKVLDIIIQDQQ